MIVHIASWALLMAGAFFVAVPLLSVALAESFFAVDLASFFFAIISSRLRLR